MCKLYITIIALFTSLLVEILAVNSPQMTFFTPPSHEAVIHLESKYGHSATLKLNRQRSVAQHAENSNSLLRSSKNLNVTAERRLFEYVILGPDYPFYGVSAIIQQMNLRTDTGNHGCRDFVQFSTNTSQSGQNSNKICGQISRDENWNEKNVTDPRLQRSFFSPSGTIYLYFYSDYLDEADTVPDVNNGNHDHDSSITNDIEIEIVFTSYTVCPNPANSWKKLKTCSRTEKMACIYSTLFCDSKIDCGFPGEFGVDEEGCYIPYIYMSISIFGTIFITSSLIYLFIRWVTKVPKDLQ